MITLYSKATSNGRKASIMLEETGLPYRVRPVDLAAGEQKQPWFLAINPNGRIPALHDDSGPAGSPVTLFESGAILVYLAEKSGRFLPGAEGGGDPARAEVLSWMFFASTHLTFTGMQVHWLVRERRAGRPCQTLPMWQAENARLWSILDLRLAGHPWLGGETYSIADIAAYPWAFRHAMQEIDPAGYPHVRAWLERVGARPAVRRGMAIPPRSLEEDAP